MKTWIEDGLKAAGRGLVLALTSFAASLALFILWVLSASFILLGVGAFTTPLITRAVRGHANLRRRVAHDWYGIEVPVPYRPEPQIQGNIVGQIERTAWIMKDPATYRDLGWLLVDMTAGFALALLPIALICDVIVAMVMAFGVWKAIPGGYWFLFIHIDSEISALAAVLLGLVELGVGLTFGPRMIGWSMRLSAQLLRPTRQAELTQRVQHLSETRSDAVDASAAELRRIERDLHDGAQARLVAVGMSLGTIERLLEQDPQRAAELVRQAKQTSADALTELRDLVRGIHPPVLAERGLPDAVRALALRNPIPTEVAVELEGRPAAPIESAAYFTISELFTNAVKYSGASRVWVDIRYEHGLLRVGVTDDGSGGARITPEGGLGGVERRLGTFDGVLAVSSPPGGPTTVTMEIPCELSSPKTSSS